MVGGGGGGSPTVVTYIHRLSSPPGRQSLGGRPQLTALQTEDKLPFPFPINIPFSFGRVDSSFDLVPGCTIDVHVAVS